MNKQMFEQLSEDMENSIDKQRKWVLDHEKTFNDIDTKTYEGKIGLIQSLFDGIHEGADSTKYQALGIVLGDVLAELLNLKWVIYSDEYGPDLALRYKITSIVLFPISMITKRVDEKKKFNVAEFVEFIVNETKKAPEYSE